MSPVGSKAKGSRGTADSEADYGVESLETWQARALDRRLSGARARALARSSRFLATALDLVQEMGRADFTVQDLVDRSNLSLRAFYQHFSGKDELLLALYENVQSQFTEDIRHEVAAAEGPMNQLEAFCRGFLSRAESSEEVCGRIVVLYNLSLELEHPAEFAKVWEPHQKLLTQILTACSRAGLLRKDLSVTQLTTLMTTTLTALGQFSVLHAGSDAVLTLDDVWAWCRQAISPAAEGATTNQRTSRTSRQPKVQRSTKAARG